MPDIFLYGALTPAQDIRLCDPTALCAPAVVVVVPVPTGGDRRHRRERLPAPVQPKPKGPWRKRQQETWVEGAPVPEPTAPTAPAGSEPVPAIRPVPVGVGVVVALPPLVELPPLVAPWTPTAPEPFAVPEPWAPPVVGPEDEDEAVSLLLMAHMLD